MRHWLLSGLLLLAGVGCQKSPSFRPEAALLVTSTGTIGMNGTLSKSLGQANILPLEAAQVERALHPLFNVRRSRPTDRFEIQRSTSGQLVQMTYWPNAFDYYVVKRSSGGLLSAHKGEVESQLQTVGVQGEIQGSLWEAMSMQGVPPEMIIRFAELFSWRIDFLTEPRKGDRYQLVWTRSVGNGATREETILVARYINREKNDFQAYPLAGDYFDVEGQSLKGEFLRAPLVYRRISSYFTERRYHPILRYYRPHHGIDYAAPYGTPASTVADGVVISKGNERGLGNEVRVRHAGSYTSIYGHLRGFAKGIHVGAKVKQGQVVGYVGSTGLSTGPHLHFGFEQSGRLINFFSLKTKNSRKSVPVSERAHFEAIKRDAQALLAQLSPTLKSLQVLKN